MLELRVRGNKESFQLTKKLEYMDICLKGNFEYHSTGKIDLLFGDIIKVHSFKNRNDLFDFCNDIRGKGLDSSVSSFLNYGFDIQWINHFTSKKATEISLLKSIFLIYQWIEIYLRVPGELDIKKPIFNEFVVDWTHKPEPQNDIYFIPQKYLSSNLAAYIQKLMDLNLLVSFKILSHDKEIVSNYFIPLVKPGVSRDNFVSTFDSDGYKTYSLWKDILKDRDIRISTWINNRF